MLNVVSKLKQKFINEGIKVKNYTMELSLSTKYTSNTIIEVDKQSEKELFEEVYKLAKYFKEELNYDSVTYGVCSTIQVYLEQAYL